MAEAALSRQNWQELQYWIKRLPEGEQQTQRWQYWWARAVMQDADSTGAEAELADPQTLLTELAAQRLLWLYGGTFVATNTPPKTELAGAGTDKSLKSNPHIRRAIELFAVGEHLNGRREWYRALGASNNEEKRQLGHLAQKYRQSIS